MTAPLPAQTALSDVFAGCVGRMSAEMEHAWIVGATDAEQHAAERLTFLSLLEATAPIGTEAEILHRRIEAKMAHAALLTSSTFSDRPDQAERARIRATWHIAQCREMLLDS